MHSAAPFIVMGVFTMVSAVLCWWLPETKGVPAADTSASEPEGEELESPVEATTEKDAILT